MSDLTPARLRELIAAATPGPWRVHENPRFWIRLPIEEDGDPNRDNNAGLVAFLVNRAAQIAEALEWRENMLAEFPLLMEACQEFWKTHEGVDALRAAKEAK